MKLAEALMLRGDMQTRLAKLRERLTKSAIVQDGDRPPEDPARLLSESVGIITDLHVLVERIHRTNQAERTADGRTLASLMSERDRLRQTLALVQFAAEAATTNPDNNRYSPREIKWVPQLDVAPLHKQADDLSAKLRELNAKLQEANWQAELRP